MYTFESYFSNINLTFNHIAPLIFNTNKFALFCFIHFLALFEQVYFICAFYSKSTHVLTKS